ncbi:MAG: hypothetical protein PHC84_05105, partial [Clostridia bacterium]|nr:hypothetical protein [Clostridia bacterium]
ISLARSISVESVKHLAQHTNLISSITKKGDVLPNKILNTSKEESFEVYENRFIYTLLLKVREFIERRYDSIKNALLQSGELGVDIKSEFNIDGHKMTYSLDSTANIPFDEVVKSKSKTGLVSNVERLNRIKSIINDFLSGAFAKEMRACALVRPPIQRTNVILKDPNFKKALMLWQYVESTENLEFKVETSKETTELPPAISDKYTSLIFWNTILVQSIAASRDAGDSLEETKKKQQELTDEYITKNIDDFVPDDFPQLKMDLHEVRRIYYRIPGAKTLRLTEISKINAALDRVLRQYRINKAKEDSALQKRLIAQQLKEEAQAKKIALREAKELERLKKKEEERARIEAARKMRERKAAEKEAERQRKEAQKQAAEQKRLYEESKLAEAKLLAEQEAAEIARRQEQDAAKAFEEQKLEAERRLREETEAATARLLAEREAYWEEQRQLAVRLLTERITVSISERQKDALAKLRMQEKVRLETIRKMEALLRTATALEHNSNLDRLLEQARTFHSDEEVIAIQADAELGRPAFVKLEAEKRLEILKTQLEVIKSKREKAKAKKEKKANAKKE